MGVTSEKKEDALYVNGLVFDSDYKRKIKALAGLKNITIKECVRNIVKTYIDQNFEKEKQQCLRDLP